MGKNASIDSHIKDYYNQFKNCNNRDIQNFDNIYDFTLQTAEKNINSNEKRLSEILLPLSITQDDIAKMVVSDAWYHIYENILFLDARYNIDVDIQESRHNKDFGVEDTVDIISLNEHLNNKGLDKNHKRRYRDSIETATEYFTYEQIFKIPKMCPIYVDYYSIYSPKEKKRYLYKPYLDIIDFFHTKTLKKSDAKFKMKSYTIWDIDSKWLPAIAELYACVQAGRNNIFQFQLIERMFKFRLLMYLDNNITKIAEDMLYYIQPFTQLGYSSSMMYYINKFDEISKSDYEKVLASILFNAIVHTIKTVLRNLLLVLWKKRTNEDKSEYIRALKKQADLNGSFKDIDSYFNYIYSDNDILSDDLMSLYKALLFNEKFQCSNARRHFDSIDINDYSDIDDDEDEDDKEFYYDANYEGEIKSFYNSLYVEPITDEPEWNELYDYAQPITYEYDFSDMLYLITELEYSDYYPDEPTDEN